MSIKMSGLLLNPLILGGGAFILLAAPIMLFRIARRALRRKENCCTKCNYPLGPWERCPECGNPTPAIAATTT
jgi:hypothetical protein